MSTKSIVFSKNKARWGKGFSLGELAEVQLSPKNASKLGLSVDKRRKTVLEKNVKALQALLSK